ncbi:MAG: efflux RND transporter permease subunit [Candidatus Omnitrophota bacterium]
MSLPQFVIKKPVTISMFFLAVLLLGLISLTRLPVELLPDTNSTKITIMVNVRGGIPPTEIENSVTKPIEDVISDANKLKDILSMSKEGRSEIVLRFEPGTNMDFATMEVREKYDQVKNKLPREVEKPVIARYEETDEPIVILAVTSQVYSPELLRKVTDDKVKGELEKVEGVANVEIYGGRERKILVETSQPRLQAYRMSIMQPVNMLGVSNLNLLAGEIKKTTEKSLIRTIGELKGISEIGELGVFVTEEGGIIKLNDIASVTDSFLEAKSIARVNSEPVVTIYIQKESGANTIKIADSIKKQLSIIRSKIDKDIKINYISDQADFIKAAIKNVIVALIIGAILSAICLWFFLKNLRATFIIAISIPISVLATFTLMYLMKINLNVMTLSGLALGVGMLVDNSVVVIENIVRKNESGMNLTAAIISGTEEVIMAIVASTLTTVIVFFPLVFVNKNIQTLYSGSAMTIVFSLLASLIVAVFLVPMLASKINIEIMKGRRLNKLLMFYRKFFRLALKNKGKFLGVVFLLFLAALFGLTRMDKEFISPFEEGRFTVFAKLEAGAKLSLMDDMTKEIEKVVSSAPELKTMTVHIEDWSSRIYVNLKPLSERRRSVSEVIDWLRPKLKEIEKKYKGGFVYFSEAQEGNKSRELIIDLFGHDYNVIDKLVSEVGGRVAEVKGMVDIKRSIEEGRPELRIIVDRKKAAMYGLSVEDIADNLHAMLRGLVATYYRTEGREIEVIVRLDEKYRDTVDKVRTLTLIGSEGQPVYLEQVASIKFDIGPSEIWRKDKKRMIEVSAISSKFSLDKVIAKLKTTLPAISFPKDYFYRFGDNYEIMQRNKRELSFALILTLLLVYMIMASLYESFYYPLIIMLTVPMAMIGVVSALLITHTPINIGVTIGSMVLGGIVVNNAIILIDHIINLLRGKGFNLYKAVIIGCEDRLRPILITSLTTIFGMVPLAVSRSEGSSLWAPLGVTVIGGMISSTFLTLFIIPVILIIFDGAILFFRKKFRLGA